MASNTQPIAVVARLLDLTDRRVQQLAREGVIPAPARSGPDRGRYDVVGAVRGYVHYLREQIVRSQSGTADFGAERARLVKAKADLAEMDAGARRIDLLPAGEVEEAWIAVLARLRARLLVLPDRLAPLVHEEITIAGARASIRETIAEALNELSSLPIEAAPDPEGSGTADPGGTQSTVDLGAAAGADHQ